MRLVLATLALGLPLLLVQNNFQDVIDAERQLRSGTLLYTFVFIIINNFFLLFVG